MSDANLLAFGCVVTFIGLAGAYVYVRESFASGEEPARSFDAIEDDVAGAAGRSPARGESEWKETA